MKYLQILIILIVTSFIYLHAEAERTRVVVMADMGNETDEEQQMLHMLLYANMFDLEGLIAVSGKYLRSTAKRPYRQVVHPELFTKLIDGYEQVRPNLMKHADNWPTAEYLHSIVRSGTAHYGSGAVGQGNATEGSRHVEAVLMKDDPRNIYFIVNAGSNTLAQALDDLDRRLSPAEMAAITKKIYAFCNGAQDDCGAWIMNRYPNITWYRSNRQTYAYGGQRDKNKQPTGPYVWEPYDYSSRGHHEWAEEHIMRHHGPLGALYPYRYRPPGNQPLEGGGTIPFMGLVNQGLGDPWRLWWGGWSGRVSREQHPQVWSRHADIARQEQQHGDFLMYEADTEIETWVDPESGESFTGLEVPVWRFRRAMWNDFRARMDWCVADYADANHNPLAAVNGDTTDTILQVAAVPDQILSFDATASSDPDGDNLAVAWWVYAEAGTYDGQVTLVSKDRQASLQVPADAQNSEIHLILEVRDVNAIVPLYDYRRIVITVVE